MRNKLSPPALHHLVCSAYDTPLAVSKSLIQRYLSRPPFSYKLLGNLVEIAMKADVSQAQFDSAVRKHQPQKFQSIFLELTPLIHKHFNSIRSKYILQIEPRKYLINDIEIPFKPPFAFELNGELVIPWFIFWKTNPLTDYQYSLFATLVDQVLQQDPDLRDAKVLIYDFSAKDGADSRTLLIKDASEIPRLNPTELQAALETIVDGFKLAQAELSKMQAREVHIRKRPSLDQNSLFPDGDEDGPQSPKPTR